MLLQNDESRLLGQLKQIWKKCQKALGIRFFVYKFHCFACRIRAVKIFWLKPLFHQINTDSYGIIMEALTAASVNSKRVELEIWGWSWINDNLIKINFILFLWVRYWYLVCFNKFISNQNNGKEFLLTISHQKQACYFWVKNGDISEWNMATYLSKAYRYLQFKINPSSVARFIGQWHHYKTYNISVRMAVFLKSQKCSFPFFQQWMI